MGRSVRRLPRSWPRESARNCAGRTFCNAAREALCRPALQFGAAFAGAIIDPVNIAASFIPVVGQARFSAMVARVGLTRARLSTGFVEGVIGNAAIEPGTLLLADAQQLDYTAADALVNVGIGGLIGAPIHAVGGAAADAVQRKLAVTRETALRSSVSQLAQGRQVDVEPVLDADPARPPPDPTVEEVQRFDFDNADRDDLTAFTERVLVEGDGEATQDLLQGIRSSQVDPVTGERLTVFEANREAAAMPGDCGHWDAGAYRAAQHDRRRIVWRRRADQGTSSVYRHGATGRRQVGDCRAAGAATRGVAGRRRRGQEAVTGVSQRHRRRIPARRKFGHHLRGGGRPGHCRRRQHRPAGGWEDRRQSCRAHQQTEGRRVFG